MLTAGFVFETYNPVKKTLVHIIFVTFSVVIGIIFFFSVFKGIVYILDYFSWYGRFARKKEAEQVRRAKREEEIHDAWMRSLITWQEHEAIINGKLNWDKIKRERSIDPLEASQRPFHRS